MSPAVKDAAQGRDTEDGGGSAASSEPPRFLLGDQMFWGQDRIDFLKEALSMSHDCRSISSPMPRAGVMTDHAESRGQEELHHGRPCMARWPMRWCRPKPTPAIRVVVLPGP
jgi:hypothetical protein